MKTLQQFLGGLVSGAVVIALIASGLVLTAGDLRIASLTSVPSPTASAAPPISGPSALPDASAALTTSPTVVWTPTLVPTSTCPRPPGWIDHLVAEGEDLPGIAARYGIDPVVLQVNNCLVAAFVTPNMILFVPAPPTLTPTVAVIATVVIRPTVCGPPLGWTIYRVRPGDTLSSIARATGSTVQALMLANCLPSDKIRVGQILYVPRLPIPTVAIPFTPTPTPTPSPSPTGTPTPTPVETLVTPEPTTPGAPSPSPPPTETPPAQSPTPTPTFDDPPATDTPSPTVPTLTTEPPPTTVPPPTNTPVPNVTP